MVEEYTSIMRNDVWNMVLRLEGKSIVSSRWIYKINHVSYGSIDNLKDMFVARGFSQKEGVDYEDNFSPVTKYSSIQVLISISSIMKGRIHHMDVKIKFLNGIIEEEVYLEQPQGFEIHRMDSHVCRLKKSLYRLKQAPSAWYSRIDGYLQSMVFTKSEVDPNLYFILFGEDPLILVFYIDDLFLTGAKEPIIGCKADLASEFKMVYIVSMHYFLGLEVWQVSREILFGKWKYALDILRIFGMEDCKPMATPMITNIKKINTSYLELLDRRIYK
jgi:hypothetical protein